VGVEVVIEFEDKGAEYNPLEKEDPDIEAGVDERPIGGLGIYMVKNMMDAVDYRREGNKNIMTIKKIIV
ncbi:MAG: ATP-binding protein, partial [Defluviitaleaceae bacterium]|nr:ATP-binding protein [Defluviitaleaceae bacterium]